MYGRNKLKRRAALAAHKEEYRNAEVQYCSESGKICCETRADAERMARSIEKNHGGRGISVYRCDTCGCYHVTRAGYEMSKNIRQNKPANRGKLYE